MEKKEHERLCVKHFLKAIGKTPTLIEESEAPDFRVHFSTQTVGIEVTKALQFGERGPDSPQAQASLAAKVIQQAGSLYDATGTAAARIGGVCQSLPLSLGRVAALAKEIADFLHSYTSQFELYHHELIEPWQTVDEMSELYSLHVMRVPAPDFGSWTANGVASVRPAEIGFRCRLGPQRAEAHLLPIDRLYRVAARHRQDV